MKRGLDELANHGNEENPDAHAYGIWNGRYPLNLSPTTDAPRYLPRASPILLTYSKKEGTVTFSSSEWRYQQKHLPADADFYPLVYLYCHLQQVQAEILHVR